MHLKTNSVGLLILAVDLKDRIGTDVTAFEMGDACSDHIVVVLYANLMCDSSWNDKVNYHKKD